MNQTISAYVMDSSVPRLRAGDLMKLDILYYCFATVKDGKPGLYGLKNAQLIADTRKINPNLKVVQSIGGWGAGGFSEAAFTAEGRKIFTDAAMEMVKQYDLDGIDMDWEYPCSDVGGIAAHPNDKQNFTYLLESLREALDTYSPSRKMHLSSAVGASPICVRDMEIKKIAGILDHVNVMTYDMRGFSGNAGHHTNLFPQTGDEQGKCGDKSVSQYRDAGIPLHKLVLGAAFYGRTWENTQGFNQPGEKNNFMHYTEIDQCLRSGYARYWDDKAKAPYAYDGSTFISYDDEASIAEKCRYVQDKKLAGIMFWEYGGDNTGKMLNAMFKGMKK